MTATTARREGAQHETVSVDSGDILYRYVAELHQHALHDVGVQAFACMMEKSAEVR